MEAVSDLTCTHIPVSSSQDQCEALSDGQVLLGRYMLMRQIGQGGTSCVYRVRDLLAVLGGDAEESHIAAKIVRSPVAGSSEHNHQMMLREALTTRHLSHPNILKIYDYHQDGGYCFVTMELVEGESLAELVARKPQGKLSYTQLKAIIQEVSNGLSAAHQAGVIHSDIKPSNILISESGEIKVIDFATARSYIDARIKNSGVDNITDFYGYTLAYASPQTIADEKATPSDDVFSLACIIYELITGKHPYAKKPTNTIAKDYLPPKPKELGAAQWRVLRKGLQLRSEKRYNSIQTFTRSFFRARRLPAYTAAVLALVSCSYLLVSWGITQLGDRLETRRQYMAAYHDQTLFESGVDQIRTEISSLDTTNRHNGEDAKVFLNRVHEALKALDSQDHTAVIALVKPDVIRLITDQQQLALAYTMNDVSNGQFDDFISFSSELGSLFSDSEFIHSSIQRVEGERLEVLRGLERKYYGLWYASQYHLQLAHEINRLKTRLTQFDPLFEEELGDNVLHQFEHTLATAVEDRAFSVLFEVSQFINEVDSPALKSIALGYQQELTHGAAIGSYIANTAQASAYPDEAAEYFLQPEIAVFEPTLKDLWFDKDMLSAVNTVSRWRDQFHIPAGSRVLTPISEKLKARLEGKLQFHKRKGFKQSQADIEQAIVQLLSLSSVD